VFIFILVAQKAFLPDYSSHLLIGGVAFTSIGGSVVLGMALGYCLVMRVRFRKERRIEARKQVGVCLDCKH
jgi:hypothetical protein